MARQRLHGWWKSNMFPLLLFILYLLFSHGVALNFINRFEISFNLSDLPKISSELTSDVRRIQALEGQFRPLSSFLRLELVQPVVFEQNARLLFSRSQLAGSGNIVYNGDAIFSRDAKVTLSSNEIEKCIGHTFSPIFPVQELGAQLDFFVQKLLPECFELQFGKASTLEGAPTAKAPIQIRLDKTSQFAVKIFVLFFIGAAAIFFLKVYRSIWDALNLRTHATAGDHSA